VQFFNPSSLGTLHWQQQSRTHLIALQLFSKQNFGRSDFQKKF
jgi:hypothetical protein